MYTRFYQSHAGFPEPNPTFSPTTSTLQATPTAVSTYQSVYLVGTMVSPTVSATPTQQQLTDGQTGLPMSTIIILSAVIPSTLVLLMIVCTVVVILIVRWRIARKQVDAAHEHKGKLLQWLTSYITEKNYLVRMATSAGYCSFRVHWTGHEYMIKEIWSSINPLTILSSFKEPLSASQHTSVHMHPSPIVVTK